MNIKMRAIIVACIAILLLVHETGLAVAADVAKHQYKITMRDGIRLFTTVFHQSPMKEPAPIILIRTPFGSHPYDPDILPEWIPPDKQYLEEGYIIAIQDVRGTFMSEGIWRRMNSFEKNEYGADETTDTWDTVEWLIRNVDNNNGKVCLWGGSFAGYYAAVGLVNKHPAVVCSVPQGPSTDWWGDDVFHNGAVQLPHIFWGFSEFGEFVDEPSETQKPILVRPVTQDGYEFFLREVGGLANVDRKFFFRRSPNWNDLVSHPKRDDFWKTRNLHHYLRPTDVAVLVVGGWFDAEDLYGALKTYETLSGDSDRLYFVLGPWEHVQWMDGDSTRVGDITYPDSSPLQYRSQIQKTFLDHHLKGIALSPDLPKVRMYDTGAYQWRQFETWPPADLSLCTLTPGSDEVLHLGRGGQKLPKKELSFISNPFKPVPYSDYLGLDMDPHYMNKDQRFAARRPDVLVFKSNPLEDPLTISGPIHVRLQIKTTAQDADFVVKVIDVQPDQIEDWPQMSRGQLRSGYQVLVRGDIFRTRYRQGFDQAVALEPNEVAQVEFTLNDVLHTFEKGHRIMIQIQSTWFPLFDRNPQTWVDNLFEARDDDFHVARHSVLIGGDHESEVTFLTSSSCGRPK